MKIGLISDTHSAGSGRDLPRAVFDALAGCDLLLHCGDLESIGALDYLEELAPVLAVRGYEDPVEAGERLANVSRIVEVEGVRIGMVHDIQWPPPAIATTPDGTGLIWPERGLRELLEKKFGGAVDVVVFGDTHEEMVEWREGVLFVNPGSPTYPGRRHAPRSLGTVAVLDISDGEITATIVDLSSEIDDRVN